MVYINMIYDLFTLVFILINILRRNLQAMSNLFLSLFLAAVISFSTLAMLVSLILGFLTFISYIPGFLDIGSLATNSILNFLAVFGNGKPVEGIITLGLTLSIVAVLLDILNFYRYQSLRDKDFS